MATYSIDDYKSKDIDPELFNSAMKKVATGAALSDIDKKVAGSASLGAWNTATNANMAPLPNKAAAFQRGSGLKGADAVNVADPKKAGNSQGTIYTQDQAPPDGPTAGQKLALADYWAKHGDQAKAQRYLNDANDLARKTATKAPLGNKATVDPGISAGNGGTTANPSYNAMQATPQLPGVPTGAPPGVDPGISAGNGGTTANPAYNAIQATPQLPGVPTGAPPGVGYTGNADQSAAGIRAYQKDQYNTAVRSGNEAAVNYWLAQMGGNSGLVSQAQGQSMAVTQPVIKLHQAEAGPQDEIVAPSTNDPPIPPLSKYNGNDLASIIANALDAVGVGMSAYGGVQREGMAQKQFAQELATKQYKAQKAIDLENSLASIDAQTAGNIKLAIAQGDKNLAVQLAIQSGMTENQIRTIEAQADANVSTATRTKNIDIEIARASKAPGMQDPGAAGAGAF